MPGYGIKNVSHSKYTPPKWSDITGNCYVASPGTGYAAYDPYGAAQKYYPNSEISLQYAAYSAAEEMRARWTYTKVSGPASVNVQNRQGELPSRIVKALDGYHSTTDIIESRDFPRLLELLARRRNLANYMREIAGSLRGRQWSATLKELREIGLAAKFGLDPTVQQIQELIKELKTPKKRRGSSFSVALKSEFLVEAGTVSVGPSGTRIRRAGDRSGPA
jgi:ribosomal protein S15P/S13E